MSDILRKPQKRWNAEHYKQFNIALPPALIDAFRAACEQNNVSMRAALVTFMSEFAQLPKPSKPSADIPQKNSYALRAHRRKAVASIIKQLEDIKDAESLYRENMPSNLKSSSRYDSASFAIDSIDAAIDSLISTFDS